MENLSLHLTSDAGEINILRKLNFTVGRGESVGITGPSGSGKTSLLLLLAGLERPSEGRIEFSGTDMASLGEDSLAELRGRRIGIVFQSFHLVPSQRAWENVALPLELAGAGDAEQRARHLLGELGLADRADHFPSQLSGGEQQRVAIARAVAADPVLLLADEPTGNLDQRNGTRVMDLLFSLQETRNATFLLVTHDSTLAARCDRILQLEDGRLEA